ncbi:MAG: response regulator [Acidobacteriota bacterium]
MAPDRASDAAGTPAVRVLLVDDEEVFRETLAKLLRRRGLAVATAESGEQAISHLASTGCDVVVLDLRMPGIGGLETLRRIGELRPATRVIILTGHGTVTAGLEAIGQLAFDFLLKPVAPEQLAEVIIAAAEGRPEG